MSKYSVSSRALNPLSMQDDPSDTFCCKTQAKATTASKFFRNEEMLSGLKAIIIPKYLQKKSFGGLDVWSAGCSSGEEVYSLACIGLYALKLSQVKPKLTIYGTDISKDQLRKSKAGRYLKNSSASTLKKYNHILLKYATIENEVIQMGSEVKAHVKFGKFDLRARPKKHTFNYITCNHVFQYYDADAQVEFIDNFLSVLKAGGIMFIEGLSVEAYKRSQIKQVYGYKNLFEPEL